ncbi:membrane-bound lytic murein transglycosylase MltF [Sulfurimonas sp. MAG313]|nr:membrane-bound lytic murein transglycosylase MltF [Sulfurimonas sp. MAG313]MDF1880386.1 membrane-bound lytic murein transglycosylase MltF [Sulfurimonas sp. MAG313]
MLKIFILASVFFGFGWYSQSYISFVSKKNVLSSLDKIKAKKRLDVIILNSPTVYYMGPEKEMGFEYELLSSYAKEIGVDLNLTVVNTVDKALELSKEGFGDITAAGLSVTKQRQEDFIFGPKYFLVQEQMICHKDMYKQKNFPKDMEDLSGLNVVVGKKTSYAQTLHRLETLYPKMKVVYDANESTESLLEMVWKKEIDCTVADSNIFSINQRYYPELSMAFAVSERKHLAWILRKNDSSLKNDLYMWINRCEQTGKMAELRDFYYSYLNIFDYYDTKIFHKRLKSRLPQYETYFKEAGKKYKIPWVLLAAQSYQESHWRANAKSHTGVRGMMMLTLNTAKSLGVKNRLDAKQSIFGGAKYIAKMEKRFGSEVKGKNRMMFALAAYNVGMGHMHDAQTLARRLNKNPYSWRDIKTVLPLLSQKKYYKQLKYGYARGNEPVRYVSAIHQYADIIYKYKK